MTPDELYDEIKSLCQRITELEREVAYLRSAANRRDPVYAPTPGPSIQHPVYPYAPVVIGDGIGEVQEYLGARA